MKRDEGGRNQHEYSLIEVPKLPFVTMGFFSFMLYNTEATSHMQLLNACNEASVTEELNSIEKLSK